ncbi:MAG: tetratricopeptide repeat protein [Saprospiraceae bacterium]
MFNTLAAQTKSKENAVQQAKKHITQKNYTKAEILLASYYQKHQKDLETIWLYAQVAHWNHHEALSASLFKRAIDLAPEDYNLKLDFARMSYESGRTNTALELIKEIRAHGKASVEALLLQANILFWYGKIKEAKTIVELIKQYYPGTYITQELEKKINLISKTHLKSNVDFQSDSQPMKVLSEQISIEQFKSWFYNPKLSISNANFTPAQNTLEANLSNNFLLGKYRLSAILSIGIYKNFIAKTNWNGNLELKHNPDKKSRINAGLNRSPYLGTLQSTSLALAQNNAFFNVESEHVKRFLFHAGYNLQFFDDNNSIHSVGAWGISKPNPKNKFNMQYGIGISYSNSKNNVFESILPLFTLVNQYTDGMQIAGVFNPYFTPQNQLVNTALLMMNYRPLTKLEIGIKANYGFYAVCDNPYLYLEKNKNDEIGIEKKYSKVRFNPYEIQANVNYKFTTHFDASLKYINQETFFYSRNLLCLSLHYIR